jgi:hypothetical protein
MTGHPTPISNPLMTLIRTALRRVAESSEGGVRLREILWLHHTGNLTLSAIAKCLPHHPDLRIWEVALRDHPFENAARNDRDPPEDTVRVFYLRVGNIYVGVATDYLGQALQPVTVMHEEGAIQRALSSVSSLALPESWRVQCRYPTMLPEVPEEMQQRISAVFDTDEARAAVQRGLILANLPPR